MPWNILVSAPYLQPVLERFRPLFEANDCHLIVPPVKERLSEEELLEMIGDIDGVIAGDDDFTAKVLEAAPRLKVLSKWGTGIDSFDSEACARLGIAIRNTPNAFSEPVGDTVLGFMLAFARNIPWADKDIRAGVWEKRPGFSLVGKTLAVIGVGNCGQAVGRRAPAFRMKLLGVDIKEIEPDFVAEVGLEVVSHEEAFRRADFVSLNCDLNPTSYHLVRLDQLEMMKPTAYLINAARGPLIEEASLVEVLERKLIAGAALDVFENEPLPAQSALRRFDNVLFSPHNANSDPDAWERVHQRTIENLLEELRRQ